MAVTAFRELPRENTYKFGEPRRLRRRWVCTVDNPKTAAPEYSAALDLEIGRSHPDYESDRCVEIQLIENYEGSRYHTEVVAVYGMPTGGAAATEASPLNRPPVWSFQTQGVAVPVFTYFVDGGRKALTNSAFDYYQGITADEAQTKVLIKRNLSGFPSSLSALTNTVNNSAYLGGGNHTWKCQGIGAELRHETVNGIEVAFWEVTVELLFRQSGWNLKLPDVGFNYIEDGQKRRAVVFDFENSEWVPSPGPVGLNGLGQQTLGTPFIHDYRIYEEADFGSAFGNPPT